MKQGTVVNRGTKSDTLDWLQETIDMLARYKAEVEAGEIVITSGDASVTSPAPATDISFAIHARFLNLRGDGLGSCGKKM